MNHAFSQHIVDLVGMGVVGCGGDRRPIFRAAVTVAMSVASRGGTQSDWIGLMQDGLRCKGTKRNVLWHQINSRNGGKSEVPWDLVRKFLDKAWSLAVTSIAEGDDRDHQQLANDWEDALPLLKRKDRYGKMTGLSDYEKRVMGYVIEEIRNRDYPKVTCPGRDVAERCKFSHLTAVNNLKRLADNGFLICVHSGYGGATRRKAAIYKLPNKELLLGLLNLAESNGSCGK